MRRALGRWVASLVLVLATARCGGGAFTDAPADPVDLDAQPSIDATEEPPSQVKADGGLASDASVGVDAGAITDAGDEGRVGPRDSGRRVDGAPEDAASADAGSRDAGKDAAGPDAAFDAGCSDVCGTLCCLSTQHCCQGVLIRLDGGTGAAFSCESNTLVCPLTTAGN